MLETFRSFMGALLLVAALILSTTARAQAEFELAYYRAASTSNAVYLEWGTRREVNVNGFEILYKRVGDEDATYTPIGSRVALGSNVSGATYNFDVTTGLIPGGLYCFRLHEVTSDDQPGEAFDLCGYGVRHQVFLPTAHKQR